MTSNDGEYNCCNRTSRGSLKYFKKNRKDVSTPNSWHLLHKGYLHRNSMPGDFRLLSKKSRNSLFQRSDSNKSLWKSGHRYVVKKLQKSLKNCSSRMRNAVQVERQILKKVNHPLVASFYRTWHDHLHAYYMQPYYSGESLESYITTQGPLKIYTVQFLIAEILNAIQYIHAQHIVIRDIRPDNILLDQEGHVKLVGFSLSKSRVRCWTYGATTICGMEPYIGAEVYEWACYGQAVDMWALGMILYEMLAGGSFEYMKQACINEGGVVLVLNDLIHSLKLTAHVCTDMHCSAYDLVKQLIQRNPFRRLGANGARESRSHKFFKNINWKALLYKTSPLKTRDGVKQSNSENQFINVDSVNKHWPVQYYPTREGITGSKNKYGNFKSEVHSFKLQQKSSEHRIIDKMTGFASFNSYIGQAQGM